MMTMASHRVALLASLLLVALALLLPVGARRLKAVQQATLHELDGGKAEQQATLWVLNGPETVSVDIFKEELTAEDLRLTKRLGGGSFGEVFECHIKKDSRPAVYPTSKLFSWIKVPKEKFAVKFMKNGEPSAALAELTTLNKNEAKAGEYATRHMMCPAAAPVVPAVAPAVVAPDAPVVAVAAAPAAAPPARCECFPNVNPQFAYWHEKVRGARLLKHPPLRHARCAQSYRPFTRWFERACRICLF
jgi:hypothetical protein